jgi:flagellar hook-associated protein 1 FlgK
MSLLNVGARALLANQVALQTAGHNIANVNTPGYSRQTVVLQTVQGQFTGGGYIGQGVDVQTILRNQSELLTRQAAAAGSTQSADATRAERLRQLQEVFSGGTTGLGAAINDMMNSFSDVVSSPTDLTARTVALTRIDETAARMRSASDRINEIQYTVTEQLGSSITAINSLASQIASVNEQIARAKGNGQTPNDLLDHRDQLIRDINQYVQTTQIPADDGTVGLFVAGSQPLVLGTNATPLSVGDTKDFPGSGQLKLYFNPPGATPIEIDENMLGGGSVSGLLRFNNTDLAEGRNLLGRMALAIGTTMNYQQTLGLTLDGAAGKPLFATPASVQGYTAGSAVGTIDFTDTTKFSPTQFAASDYEVRFDAAGVGGQVVRLSDGKATAFASVGALAATQIDGLTFNFTTAGAANERVLFKPFASAAGNIQALVYSPRDLAAANPVNAAMGSANAGTLQLAQLKATGVPTPPGLVLPPNGDTATPPAFPGGIQLRFNAGPPATYDVLNRGSSPATTVATAQPYTPGAPISIDGWQITLQGTPKSGDTVNVGNALDPQYGDYYTRNAGNASALMGLRDVKMFDNATLSDGYAGAIAQVGTRTQSASFAADLSTTIAANLERDRTAVSGVNLDEEAAKLIQFQQAYQASAKMLQIAQNIFDNLIQTVGR